MTKQDAKAILEEVMVLDDSMYQYNKKYLDALNMAIEALSAQPQRMRGKWVYGEDEYGIDGYHCDKCGFFVPWDYAHTFINYIEDYNFCPSCGAQMEDEG